MEQLRLPIYTSMSALFTEPLKTELAHARENSNEPPAPGDKAKPQADGSSHRAHLEATLIDIALKAAKDVGETEPQVLKLIEEKVRSGRIVLLLDSFTYSDAFAGVRAALGTYLDPKTSPDAQHFLAVQRISASDPSVVAPFGRPLHLFDLKLFEDSDIVKYITRFFADDRDSSAEARSRDKSSGARM